MKSSNDALKTFLNWIIHCSEHQGCINQPATSFVWDKAMQTFQINEQLELHFQPRIERSVVRFANWCRFLHCAGNWWKCRDVWSAIQQWRTNANLINNPLNTDTPHDGWSRAICELSSPYRQHTSTLSSSHTLPSIANPRPFPHTTPSVQCIFLHGWAHAAYSRQDSCLPCIMCPLRAPSGRWKPTRASCIHGGSHHYGKVCKHMVLNRDVQSFPLECATHIHDVIKMQWGPCEMEGGLGGLTVIIALLLAVTPPMPSPLCQRDVMRYGCPWSNIWKIFSWFKHAVVPSKPWICIIIFVHVLFSNI